MSGKKEALRDGDGIAALHGCSQAEVSDRRRARDQALFERGPVSPPAPAAHRLESPISFASAAAREPESHAALR